MDFLSYFYFPPFRFLSASRLQQIFQVHFRTCGKYIGSVLSREMLYTTLTAMLYGIDNSSEHTRTIASEPTKEEPVERQHRFHCLLEYQVVTLITVHPPCYLIFFVGSIG